MQSPEDLDLVNYLKRAIGEWQAIDLEQYRLVGVKYDSNVLSQNENDEFPVNFEQIQIGNDPQVYPKQFPPNILNSLKATRIYVAELQGSLDPMPEDERTRLKKIGVIKINSAYNEIVNIRAVAGEPSQGKDLWIMNEGVIPNREEIIPVTSMTQEERAECYWIQKFRRRSSSIIVGILESIPALQARGFQNWLLPTGDKVPLDTLKLCALDIATPKLSLVDLTRCVEVGQTKKIHNGKEFTTPKVELLDIPEKSVVKKVFAKEIDQKIGIVSSHFLLETILPDGSLYVFDPTARQFGFKGRKGTLVVHGTFEKYSQNFPGIIKKKVKCTNDFYQLVYFMGNGPSQLVERLSQLLIKYFERRICNYCGQIEGCHPEPIRTGGIYKYEETPLFNCSRCKKVGYCGGLCQKLDWKLHKLNCQQTIA